MKDKKNLFVIGAISLLVLIIIGLVAFIIISNNDNSSDGKNKENVVENQQMSEFNISLEEQYDSILDQYFGMDYISLYDYDNLARYPGAYKDTLIEFVGYIEEVIEEKDNSYKILVSMQDWYNYWEDEKYFVIEGEYNKARYLKNDFVLIYGVYKGNDTYEINGSNKVLPKVNTVKLIVGDATGEFMDFNESELREVLDTFFGTTYTLTKPNYDYRNEVEFELLRLPFHYIVTLDNNSNARFNKYRVYPSGGRIDVVTEYENKDLRRFIDKSSDNKNFILSTYTESNDYLELQMYDKDFKAIWTRKFENAGDYLYDINNGRIALSIDNELYIIDEKTGKDIVSPIMLADGNCIKLLATGDIILVTDNAKDFIIYVNPDGTIKWKTSLSTYDGEWDNEIEGVYSILVANEKIYVGYYISDYGNSHVAVFNQKGKEEVNTFAFPE